MRPSTTIITGGFPCGACETDQCTARVGGGGGQAAAAASANALAAAKRAGDLLSQAKRAVGRHGAWKSWLAANVDFSLRTAQVYMQLSQGWEQIEAKSAAAALHLTIRQAVALLTERPPDDDDGGCRVVHNSGNYEWFTPPKILDAARRCLGGIELDPASCEAAQRESRPRGFTQSPTTA